MAWRRTDAHVYIRWLTRTSQSAILACSWVKLPVLLKSYDVWIRQHSRGRVYFTVPRLKAERLAQAPQPGSLYDRAYNTSPDAPANGPDFTTMTMAEKLTFDFGMFQNQLSTPAALPESGPLHRRLQQVEDEGQYLRSLLGTHLEVHPGTALPDDLLRGPFETEDGDVQIGVEKMHRLFWLVRGGACLQEDQLWEVTREGFREILQLVNPARPGDEETVTRRVELARRLFVLFGVLSVFKKQWPKCTWPSLSLPSFTDQKAHRTHSSGCRYPPDAHSAGQNTSQSVGPRLRAREPS